MKEIQSELRSIIDGVDVASLELRDAAIAKKKVESAIRDVKKSMKSDRVNSSDAAFASALSMTIDNAPDIYASQVRRAVRISREYNYEAFLNPLIEVGTNEDLYSIVPTGTGWNRTITVTLEMNSIAGTLEDYAEAVESARGALNVKEERDPELASKYWREKVYPYKDGPYRKTIDLRMMAAISPAPFWSLLDNGNIDTSMGSDIGGEPYPAYAGRHFVKHAEDEIRKFFLQKFREFKDEPSKDSDNIAKDIDDANELLAELQSQIDRMSREAQFMKTIAKEMGVTVSKLDAAKIILSAEKIRQGSTQAQFNITKTGDGRIRSGKLSRLLSEYLE